MTPGVSKNKNEGDKSMPSNIDNKPCIPSMLSSEDNSSFDNSIDLIDSDDCEEGPEFDEVQKIKDNLGNISTTMNAMERRISRESLPGDVSICPHNVTTSVTSET